MIDNRFLLFIEPKNKPGKKPVIDNLTKKMTACFRSAVCEGCADSGIGRVGVNTGKFIAGLSTRGFHTCSCGAASSNVDYLLPGGEITNFLCIHYLAMHREEISEEQLNRVKNLPDCGEEDPTSCEIYGYDTVAGG